MQGEGVHGVAVLFAVGLAFLAGWFVRGCHEIRAEAPQAAPPPDCPPAPVCEEGVTDAGPPPARGARRPRKGAHRTLPSSPREPNRDAHRAEVQAWVTARASELRTCLGDDEDALRVAIRFRVDDAGRVHRARCRSILARPLDDEVDRCLRQGLEAWQLPEHLRTEQRDYAFSLYLTR